MAGKSDPVRKYFLVSVVERWDPYEEARYPPGAEVGLEPSDLRILRRIVRSKSSAVFAHAPYSSIGVALSQICPLANP
jgi:hypothetical protein